MKFYSIPGPDGQVYEIQGPDDATRDQIIAAVKARNPHLAGQVPANQGGQQGVGNTAPVPAPQPAIPTAQKPGAMDDFRAGIAESGLRTFLGAKQLITGLSDQDNSVLKEMNQDMKDRSGWATGGRVLGDVAQFAVPGSKIASNTMVAVTRLLPKAIASLAAIPAAGFTSSGIQGLIASPLEQEDGESRKSIDARRLGAAAKEGVAGAVLNSTLGLLAKGATKAFTPSVEASALMDKGIQPTLQQGSGGAPGRFIGGLTSGITDPSKYQNRQVIENYMSKVMPGTSVKDMTPGEIYHAINHHFKGPEGEYAKLYKGVNFYLPEEVRTGMENLSKNIGNDNARRMYLQTIKKIFDEDQSIVGQSFNSDTLMKNYLNPMQSAIEKAQKSTNYNESQFLADALVDAKSRFENVVRDFALGPTKVAKLAEIDARYGAAKRVQDAIETGRSSTRENLTPARILNEWFKTNAAKSSGGDNMLQQELLDPSIRILAQNTAQDAPRAARNLLMKGVGGAAAVGALGPAAAIPYMISGASQFETPAKFLMGGFDKQKAAAEWLKRTNPYRFTGPAAGELLVSEK